MELSIAKLAIPRKQAVITKNVDYTITDEAETVQRLSVNEEYVTPELPGWGATVYTNNSSTQSERIADLTTGLIWYEVIDTGRTIDGYSEKRILCHLPNGNTFQIDPDWGGGSGRWVIDITFNSWWYRPAGSSAHVIMGSSIVPYSKEIRTVDGDYCEVALPTDFIAFKVNYTVYWASTHEIIGTYLSTVLDSNSYTPAGSGGLTNYRVKAGLWAKDTLTRYKKDVSVDWT